VFNTLRNVTRVPQELLDATRATTEMARRLLNLQRVVTERLGSLDRGVRDALALVTAMAADLERVRGIVEPQLERVAHIEEAVTRLDLHLSELQATLAALKGDVEDATERLPDPHTRGPLARVRETVTGRD